MKTILRIEIDRRGLSIQDVSDATGIKANTIYRHCSGSRRVNGEMAVKYERGVGIPRSVLRPDLFGDLQTNFCLVPTSNLTQPVTP